MTQHVDFYATQGDNNVPWILILKDDNGPLTYLSQATSATLHMASSAGLPTLIAPAIIADQVATPGQIQYNFLTADLAVPDMYSAQFEIIFPTRTLTFPTPGRLYVLVQSEV